MTENEELEEYNQEFNEKLSSREVKNLMTCPTCQGLGTFYSSVCDPSYWKCKMCGGKKYINMNIDKKNKVTNKVSITPIELFKRGFRPSGWEEKSLSEFEEYLKNNFNDLLA